MDEFKENLIFEMYKNKQIDDREKFKEEIKNKFGSYPSESLMVRLLGYQRKHSEMQPHRKFIKNFHEKSKHMREYNTKKVLEKHNLLVFEARNEK